jgi:hypothetical protein
MIDSKISRVRLRDLARLGRSRAPKVAVSWNQSSSGSIRAV